MPLRDPSSFILGYKSVGTFSPFLRNWCWLTVEVSDDSRARSTFVVA